MSLKIIKYNDEKFTVTPTAGYVADNSKIFVEVKNGIMYIDFNGVVNSLTPMLSIFYEGIGLKYAVKEMHTTGVLIAGNHQYGYIGVVINQDGTIYINASDAPATPLELRFSIVTPLL